MSYGAQQPEDVRVLESVLSLYRGKRLRFLEIGVHTGATARGIREFCGQNGIELDYWGIDPVAPDPDPPFPGAHFIQGDSAESFHRVPVALDVVLVDGCHCVNHVILDTLHYGSRVRRDGFMLFHDTAPHLQQSMKEPHGPPIPEFHNSVLPAHRLMGFPNRFWVETHRRLDLSAPWGGMTAYRKLT